MTDVNTKKKSVKYVSVKSQLLGLPKKSSSKKKKHYDSDSDSDESLSLKYSNKNMLDSTISFKNDDSDDDSESYDVKQKPTYRKEKSATVNTNKDGSIRLADTPQREQNPTAKLLNADEVKQKLKNFTLVTQNKIKDLDVGTFIRYVEVLEDGTYKYKPGGAIKVNKAPEYLVLISNNKSWSVQLSKHVVFVERFEDVRKDLEHENKKLKKQIETLKKSNLELHTRLSELESQIKSKSKSKTIQVVKQKRASNQ